MIVQITALANPSALFLDLDTHVNKYVMIPAGKAVSNSSRLIKEA